MRRAKGGRRDRVDRLLEIGSTERDLETAQTRPLLEGALWDGSQEAVAVGAIEWVTHLQARIGEEGDPEVPYAFLHGVSASVRQPVAVPRGIVDAAAAALGAPVRRGWATSAFDGRGARPLTPSHPDPGDAGSATDATAEAERAGFLVGAMRGQWQRGRRRRFKFALDQSPGFATFWAQRLRNGPPGLWPSLEFDLCYVDRPTAKAVQEAWEQVGPRAGRGWSVAWGISGATGQEITGNSLGWAAAAAFTGLGWRRSYLRPRRSTVLTGTVPRRGLPGAVDLQGKGQFAERRLRLVGPDPGSQREPPGYTTVMTPRQARRAVHRFAAWTALPVVAGLVLILGPLAGVPLGSGSGSDEEDRTSISAPTATTIPPPQTTVSPATIATTATTAPAETTLPVAAPRTPETTQPPLPVRSATIATPADGTPVSNPVVMTGQAHLPAGFSLWVFAKSEHGDVYLLGNQPITVFPSGEWTRDATLGRPTGEAPGLGFTVTIASATEEGSQRLADAIGNRTSLSFGSGLPPYVQAEDQVTVALYP